MRPPGTRYGDPVVTSVRTERNRNAGTKYAACIPGRMSVDKRMMALAVDAMVAQIAKHYIVTREYRFDPERRWRFDFMITKRKIAIEIEGGLWKMGRHNRPVGMIADMEKYNRAALLGWAVLRYTPEQFVSGQPLKDLGVV